MATQTMKVSDVISAKMATCYIEINGERHQAMNAKSFNAEYALDKVDVPILGRMDKPKKVTGMSGTGSATFYDVSSYFKQAVLEFKKTGKLPYFNAYVTNEDPQSEAGKQETVYKNCLFDKITLASFDVNGEFLEQTLDFSFEDCEMPTPFNPIQGTI